MKLKRTRPLGASPLEIVALRSAHPTTIETHVYDGHDYAAYPDIASGGEGALRWINVWGLEDEDRIVALSEELGLSGLSIADLFHLDQRAHTDIDGELVLTVLDIPSHIHPFEAKQITLVLGTDFVLTLQEGAKNHFEPVRKRLAAGKGRIRSSSGYLFYALCDLIIDSYFPVLEQLGDQIERLEERVLEQPTDEAMRDIHQLKRSLLSIRRAVWPVREALASLQREGVPQIDEPLLPYLRDCSDHAFQLLDMVEIARETTQGLVDLQLSSLSNRMNEVMKVLTMISTIFIPMTFIAGLYGMNFDRASPYNMPELGWSFGYVYSLVLMAVSALGILFLFWRLGWLTRKKG